MNRNTFIFIFFLLTACNLESSFDYGDQFLGQRAYNDVVEQVGFGARYVGSPGHEQMKRWLVDQLQQYGWQVVVQENTVEGTEVKNIIAKRGSSGEWVIFGAHYDTRQYADRDPDLNKQTQPVMGANDGASGVAVLLELARILPRNLDKQIWLVFFDAEDNGGINGQDWILGSRAFVDQLEENPDEVVVVDMIGDADLNIYYEDNSDRQISGQIWSEAELLGYGDVFIPKVKYAMVDDHTPFLQAGIPAVDIIDFDYPSWHTTEDTLDKVSAESLQIVGETLLQWILK
jgi:glutaminyl-peptide cyclotransferase